MSDDHEYCDYCGDCIACESDHYCSKCGYCQWVCDQKGCVTS